MKKVLGLLALTVAVTGVASAEQDFLKSINVSSEIRQQWSDKSGEGRGKGNKIGNAGFKKTNKDKLKWRNKVVGEVQLLDESDITAKFSVQNDSDRFYENGAISQKRASGWETNLEFNKPGKLGKLDANWALGWDYKSSAVSATREGHKSNTGISNEVYFGPSFDFNVYKLPVSATIQAVYFDVNRGKSADYYLKGSELVKGKGNGWGANVELGTSGNFYKGRYGTVNYGLTLTNKLRDVRGVRTDGKDAKSSVYLDYVANLGYTTPTFAGFYGNVLLENEWEKHTAQAGWDNGFTVWTSLGYKAGIPLPVGTLTVNPFVKYSVLNRATHYSKHENNKRKTTETNEVRAGLSLGLKLK